MIELVRGLRVINVLAKFENDPWKITDVRVLTGLVCPAARPPASPLGVRQYPGALKGCGVKSENCWCDRCSPMLHHGNLQQIHNTAIFVTYRVYISLRQIYVDGMYNRHVVQILSIIRCFFIANISQYFQWPNYYFVNWQFRCSMKTEL